MKKKKIPRPMIMKIPRVVATLLTKLDSMRSIYLLHTSSTVSNRNF